jgi:lipopolysaccharide/colanic/teichoic acid biosynthesis glycosyltransferase
MSLTTNNQKLIRLMDLTLASAGLLAGFPIVTMLLPPVILTMGWPPLYIDKRVGKDGKEFSHIKLKTMKPGQSLGRVFFEQDRIPTLGKWMRKLHLDEVPELAHIITGQMSLVGPRPLPKKLLTGLDTKKREQLPPGWTCLAQLELLELGRISKQRQIDLDNEYVDNKNPTLYLKILLRTGLLAIKPKKKLDLNPAANLARQKFSRNTAAD